MRIYGSLGGEREERAREDVILRIVALELWSLFAKGRASQSCNVPTDEKKVMMKCTLGSAPRRVRSCPRSEYVRVSGKIQVFLHAVILHCTF